MIIKQLSIITLTLALSTAVLTGPSQAQDMGVGDVGKDGRTFLFNQPLEGVYWNNWFGELVSGDGNTETDVRIITEDKLPFEGILRISCQIPGDHLWTEGASWAIAEVPEDVIITARRLFCASSGA